MPDEPKEGATTPPITDNQRPDQTAPPPLVADAIGAGALAAPPPWDGITEGRIVHYVIEGNDRAQLTRGKHRPAIIVDANPTPEGGRVNLVVFCDGNLDGEPGCLLWKPYTAHSDGQEPGTWHWPERVQALYIGGAKS